MNGLFNEVTNSDPLHCFVTYGCVVIVVHGQFSLSQRQASRSSGHKCKLLIGSEVNCVIWAGKMDKVGRYFTFISQDSTGKIRRSCNLCGNSYSGQKGVTSNFITHLKVNIFMLFHYYKMQRIKQYSQTWLICIAKVVIHHDPEWFCIIKSCKIGHFSCHVHSRE